MEGSSHIPARLTHTAPQTLPSPSPAVVGPFGEKAGLTADELGDGVHEVDRALDHGLLHARGVGHRGVIHAQPLDGRVELIVALLVDDSRDGGPDAAGHGGLVQDGQAVRALERGADRGHVQRLERAQLDQVDVVATGLDRKSVV